MDEKEIIQAAAEGAAKGFGEKIPPVYPDLLQPATKQVGKALGTIAGVINIALAPVAAMVWGYDKISDYLTETLSEQLKDVPEENIISPPASIVGPSIEAIKFLAKEEELRELYAQLIATSINADTTDNVHPGFVEIIKNLSTDDAKMLHYIYKKNALPYIICFWKNKSRNAKLPIQYFLSSYEKDCGKHLQLGGLNSITNLERLGLIHTLKNLVLHDKAQYENIREWHPYKALYDEPWSFEDKEIIEEEKVIRITSLGQQFCKACISNNYVDNTEEQ